MNTKRLQMNSISSNKYVAFKIDCSDFTKCDECLVLSAFQITIFSLISHNRIGISMMLCADFWHCINSVVIAGW